MNLQETMAALKKAGSEQIARIYQRHGAGDDVYGVKFADLYALEKKIKTDHDLARKLWATGNCDARMLATMVADPAALTAAEAESWLRNLGHAGLVAAVGDLVAGAPCAKAKMAEWSRSKDELVRAAGYYALGGMLRDGDDPGDAGCEKILATIEKEIHGSPNRARYAMLMAMIAVGTYRPAMRKAAVAAAKRVGPVEIDHGETGCKTPDAVTYIAKAGARADARAAKAGAKTKAKAEPKAAKPAPKKAAKPKKATAKAGSRRS